MQDFTKKSLVFCVLLIVFEPIRVKSLPCFSDWFGDYSENDSSSEEKPLPATGVQPISGNFTGTFVGSGAGTANVNQGMQPGAPAPVSPPVIVITIPSGAGQSSNTSGSANSSTTTTTTVKTPTKPGSGDTS